MNNIPVSIQGVTMQYRILAASVAAAGLAVGAAACSSSSSTPAPPAPSSSAASTPMPASSSPMPASSSPMASSSAAGASTTSDFGPGCASVPMSGAGSFTGMAPAPGATAASANPLLS